MSTPGTTSYLIDDVGGFTLPISVVVEACVVGQAAVSTVAHVVRVRVPLDRLVLGAGFRDLVPALLVTVQPAVLTQKQKVVHAKRKCTQSW